MLIQSCNLIILREDLKLILFTYAGASANVECGSYSFHKTAPSFLWIKGRCIDD